MNRADPEFSGVYELLRILSEDKLEAYMTFHKAHADVLAKHGIEHEDCVSNMRLLSLCSLASEQQEVPYSVVSDTLKVPADDVEEWVLKATQVSHAALWWCRTAAPACLQGRLTIMFNWCCTDRSCQNCACCQASDRPPCWCAHIFKHDRPA
jgi:PCI domain